MKNGNTIFDIHTYNIQIQYTDMANELIHLGISSIFFQCSGNALDSTSRNQDEPCNFTRLKRGYRVSVDESVRGQASFAFFVSIIIREEVAVEIKATKGREREKESDGEKKDCICARECRRRILDDHRCRQRP